MIGSNWSRNDQRPNCSYPLCTRFKPYWQLRIEKNGVARSSKILDRRSERTDRRASKGMLARQQIAHWFLYSAVRCAGRPSKAASTTPTTESKARRGRWFVRSFVPVSLIDFLSATMTTAAAAEARAARPLRSWTEIRRNNNARICGRAAPVAHARGKSRRRHEFRSNFVRFSEDFSRNFSRCEWNTYSLQPIEAKFHYAIQIAHRSQTWSQTCLCVSCACRRPVESWSKASCEPGLRPGSSMSRQLEPVCGRSETRSTTWIDQFASWSRARELDIVMEFGLYTTGYGLLVASVACWTAWPRGLRGDCSGLRHGRGSHPRGVIFFSCYIWLLNSLQIFLFCWFTAKWPLFS